MSLDLSPTACFRLSATLGFLGAGFFGLGIPLGIIQLCPGSTYPQIDATGFTFCHLFRKTSVPWSIIDEFFVVTLKQKGVSVHKMVGFNFVPSYDRARLGRCVAKLISKGEGALPDTCGRSAEELAELLNSYLQRARTQ